MATTAGARDVILRDGTTLRLRPPTRADRDALERFFDDLSVESRVLRFHGHAGVSRKLVESFLEPDFVERGALLAERDGRVVGLASYTRLRDPEAAESAFVVADDLRRRGIGTRLLEQLAAAAEAAGIRRFVADVAATNERMLRVFASAGFEETAERHGDEVRVALELSPTATFLEAVDRRDHTAVVASLRPFFAPASVAVAGASPRPGTIGGALFRNVAASGFPGPVWPVNRRVEPVAGHPGFASIADLPEAPDLVVVCVPGEAVLEVARDALARGSKALCVISAGFAELGAEGARRQEELLALVRSHGARLVGPNCLGIALSDPPLNATFASAEFPPGNVAVASQSGALGIAVVERVAARGLGFSSFVSVGNKADVSTNDLLEEWEDDERTAAIVMYVESFGNPRKFGRLARRIARRKPILALKGGTTRAGARAAASHTAALAGSDAAVDALFRSSGVVRAATLEELVDATALLSLQPLPRGSRVALLTNAGGLAILCADACEAAGLELPPLAEETRAALAEIVPAEAATENPVDMLGSATAETYARALPIVAADPNVDAVCVLAVPTVALSAADIRAALADAARADVPVAAVGLGEESARELAIPSFEYPESAARALARAAERSAWLARPLGTPPAVEGLDEPAAGAVVATALARDDDGWLRPDELRALLTAYGVPLVPERDAADADAAVAAARELGFPVVLKTALPGVHRTDVGGVALDLADVDAVRVAAAAVPAPYLVQPMLSGGVEVLAGLVQDPVFGPLVAFGPGGTLAELVGQASFAPAPLTDVDADELVHAGKAGQLVAGYRGAPAADADALADLLHRLGRLGDDFPEIAELDLNPVLARPDGCVALDARVRVAPARVAERLKTW